ncbi:glutathione S-transferase [Pseudomassariella vexata]|uniref:Glutathione S-transferase n=1 Tax=Pseudomassariella vexata TaxID=1141098 RepID=A0A1Y2E3Q8_9PEZI|nr:glutathione S-transferase [Pseudomassariella vexata]ORY66193.1 glutathione S-transferase [Pseudomassariella vexata]
MSLEVYHLQLSQSERIVWLLEEMQVPYDLKVFKRDPTTGLAPKELKEINPMGTAPYIRDTTTSPPACISESSAIMAYILEVYGSRASGSRMLRTPDDPSYAQYLQWFHYANGSLQPAISRQMIFNLSGVEQTDKVKFWRGQLEAQLKFIDDHLAQNKWFAGNAASAADCMIMFTLSTMRGFMPLDLGPHKNILRWMADVAERPAYKRAMEKGDDGMEPMIKAKERRFTQFPSFREAIAGAED